MGVRMGLLIWIVCLIAGGVIVALPDTGPRLFSLSRAHGPSRLDALGLLVMLCGWLVYVSILWRHRDSIVYGTDGRLVLLAVFALGVGVGLVIASAAADYAYWWAVGGALLLLVQLSAAAAVKHDGQH